LSYRLKLRQQGLGEEGQAGEGGGAQAQAWFYYPYTVCKDHITQVSDRIHIKMI